MKVLGIETSCDETALCIIDTGNDMGMEKQIAAMQVRILGNQLYSQVALHAKYGGVYPMMAKREHAKNLTPLLEKCLREAGLLREDNSTKIDEEKIKDILSREEGLFDDFIKLARTIEKPSVDAIAVTTGPGLEPALWVGVCFAKALSAAWNIPVFPVNHMEGHIVVAALDKVAEKEFKFKMINFPALALLVSGGHTQLVLIKQPLQYEIIGNTKDDAIGEAFDKVARILGLPYPGGPEISLLAEKERLQFPDKKTRYPLPRPMIHSKDLNFSFSGIKTAVLYTVQKIEKLTPEIKQEIAKEFEDAVVEVLVKKTKDAIEEYAVQTLIIGGGVSANKKIREDFAALASEGSIELSVPEISASTDNAFMIAVAGYLNILLGKKAQTDFVATGNLTL